MFITYTLFGMTKYPHIDTYQYRRILAVLGWPDTEGNHKSLKFDARKAGYRP
jgi:hypothetical protein